MVWVVLVLIAAGVGAYLIWKHGEPSETGLPIDPEQAVKAAIELHRIRSNFDVSWIKSQQRREGARLRREIAETLGPGEGD